MESVERVLREFKAVEADHILLSDAGTFLCEHESAPGASRLKDCLA